MVDERDKPSPDDIYFVTDLHLGPGRPPGVIHFQRLESFFYDDSFARFVEAILDERELRGRRATLVLGGDIFDFLAVTTLPERREAAARGIRITGEHRRVGLGSSAIESTWKLAQILKGHALFVDALGRLVAQGQRLVVVTGNHDQELYWPEVQDCLSEAILAAVRRSDPGADLDDADRRIEFRQWFYREAGRVYFEHGNQYEASNSVRFNLYPIQPRRRRVPEDELDLPVGSLFVRYLYSEVRRRNPYLSNMVSMEQYMGALARLNLLEMLGVLLRRMRFFRKALRAAPLFEGRTRRRVRQEHERRLDKLALREDLSPAVLRQIQSLKAMPDGMTKYHLTMSILKPVLGKVLKYLFYGVLAVFLWFLVFSLIQNTPWVAKSFFGKASLTALLTMTTVIAVLILINRFFSRLRQIPTGVPPGFYLAAAEIARATGVRHVVMGHTHHAEIRDLGDGVLFADCGTWTAITGDWDLLWPANRRFTLVRLFGNDLQLLSWNDTAGRFEEVMLFEDYQRRPTDVLFPPDPSQTLPLSPDGTRPPQRSRTLPVLEDPQR